MRLKSLLTALVCGVSAIAQTPAEPDHDSAAAVYFGSMLRQTLGDMEQAGLKLNRERFVELMSGVILGDSTLSSISIQQAESILRQAMAPRPQPAVPPRNVDEENAWVKSQLSLPNTVELDGGVVLQRIKEGSGEILKLTDTAMVMYTGCLSSGAVFDQTEEPYPLPVNGVISGLSRAMQQMHVGGKYRVFIPSAEAYGENGIMDIIPGNAALDFTISIEGIKK